MMDLEKLDQLYILYGFKQQEEYEQAIVYSYNETGNMLYVSEGVEIPGHGSYAIY